MELDSGGSIMVKREVVGVVTRARRWRQHNAYRISKVRLVSKQAPTPDSPEITQYVCSPALSNKRYVSAGARGRSQSVCRLRAYQPDGKSLTLSPTLHVPASADALGVISALRCPEWGLSSFCKSGGKKWKGLFIICDNALVSYGPALMNALHVMVFFSI